MKWKSQHGDRTSDLIDHFLGSIPMDAEEEEKKKKETRKPIYYNNPQNTFIRFGSGDQRATNGEITAMFHNQSFGIKSEQILLDSNLSMLNEDTIRDYRNYFKLYSPRPNLIGNDIADFCKRIGITDNEGHLNYGGLMCFGRQCG